MSSTGIRSLKNNLSHYIRRIETGERILVTDRGRVVAELRPPEGVSVDAPRMRRYDALVSAGIIRPPIEQGDPFADWPAAKAIRLPKGTAAELIDAGRGDR